MKRQMRGETQAQQVRDKLFRGPNRGDRWNFLKELFFSFFQELFSTIPILAKGQIHGSIQQKSDGLRSSHKNLNPLCCTTVQVGNLLTLVHIEVLADLFIFFIIGLARPFQNYFFYPTQSIK